MKTKTLYVIARTHMDPSWRRGFTEHFWGNNVQGTVRPYSDIEEAQILEYMDFAEKYGVKYQIEQSITVKRFLERNPDQRERFVSLMEKGLFELAGGGECVIDYNMSSGESWVRNHLYNINFYQSEFGHKAKYAIIPDAFGLPAQVPQVMRGFGYDAVIVFDRVFKNNKPFWKGLDGTLIVLDPHINKPSDRLCADCFKLLPCKACQGDGCPVCGGTGIDRTHRMSDRDKGEDQLCFFGTKTPDEMLADFAANEERDEFIIMVNTEETEVGGKLFGPLLEAAPRHNFKVKFLSYEENFERWAGDKVGMLRAGKVPAEEIDERVEGNPVATGCYTSRIEIKKQNAELEALLSAAERLAVLAWAKGGFDGNTLPRRDYPQKKLIALWNKMAFLQFHDCITSSHGDASYKELRRTCREIRLGASQIYRDAALELTRNAKIAVPEGYAPAVYFNPDEREASFASLVLHFETDVKNVAVLDADGTPLALSDLVYYKTERGSTLTASVRASVPALGWKVFFFREAEAAEVGSVSDVSVIENEYYRVTRKGNGIGTVYDKSLRRTVFAAGTFGLSVSTDIGHPWGRTTPEADHRFVSASGITAEVTPEYQRFTVTGEYSDPAHAVRKLKWTQRITLRKGEKLVRCATSFDWDGDNNHIYLNFPLPFDPENRITGEVPFGVLTRSGSIESSNLLGIEDEWPTLGFVGAEGKGFFSAILKSGLPGVRLHENAIQVSLHRSPVWGDTGYEQSNDCGRHESEIALTSWRGDFARGNASALAASFRAAPLCFLPEKWDGENELPLSGCLAENGLSFLAGLPKNVIVSALKRSEDGKDLVLRVYESAGKETVLRADARLVRTDLLEKKTNNGVKRYVLRPFEIATFRVKES